MKLKFYKKEPKDWKYNNKRSIKKNVKNNEKIYIIMHILILSKRNFENNLKIKK